MRRWKIVGVRVVSHLLAGGGHVKYVHDCSLEVDEADDDVGKYTEDFPVLSNPFWATLQGNRRCFGKIQRRYAITPA